MPKANNNFNIKGSHIKCGQKLLRRKSKLTNYLTVDTQFLKYKQTSK